jgi:branched-chain amino acid transport system permease protein
MSVYLNAFSKELGWKISSLSIATTFFFLVGGITNMLVARLIAKFDVRILIYIGAVVGAGSLYMLGLYLAYTLAEALRPTMGNAWAFWVAILASALLVGLLGAVVEMGLLRRVYAAPELFQLLATFAVALIMRDAVLWWWGPEDLLGPRAPGLKHAVQVLGAPLPAYDLLLVAIGPLVVLALWWLLRRTRFGVLIRAATQDREMVAALGVNQSWLFTGVFALGSLLAGLGGALQIPREPANLAMDLTVIGEAFVVVVVGGMGSVPGAVIGGMILGVTESVSTLFLPTDYRDSIAFMMMVAILLLRPQGLFGQRMRGED